MQSGIESLIKLALVTVLILAGLAVWLVPKTRLFRQRRISERAFVATCVVGVLCGAAGLVVTSLWPRQVLEWHLWEAMVMPFVLAHCYWFLVWRKARTSDILDEKQNLDMTYAGALSFAISIPAMSAASVLYDKGMFDAAVWYPCYLFLMLLVYSATTLHCFRRR